MPTDAPMKELSNLHGVRWFWAEPGRFEQPGLWYWDPKSGKNIHVDLKTVLPKE